MSAYLLFIREKTIDQSELEAYWAKIRATMAGHLIKVLAAYGRHMMLEGAQVQGVVVAEFPSIDRPAPFATARRIRKPLNTGFAGPFIAA